MLNCLLMVTIMVLRTRHVMLTVASTSLVDMILAARMVVSALFLSNTVSHIVLTPLESGPIDSDVAALFEAAPGPRAPYGGQYLQIGAAS